MGSKFFKLLIIFGLAVVGCSDSRQDANGSSASGGAVANPTGGQVAQGGATGSVHGATGAGATGGGQMGGKVEAGGGKAATAGGLASGGASAGNGGSTAGNGVNGGSSADTGTVTGNRPIGFASIPAMGLETTTGGAGGEVVNADTAEALLAYMDSEETLIIMIGGTIDLGGMTALRSNKSLIGLEGARLINGGLELYKRQNIIIRNITFADGTDDTIKINQNTHHIWVDHCDFTNSADGLFDITRQSSYITISWNHFYKHSKTMLIGHSDSETGDAGFLKTTIHNNWFDGTEQRHPRVRFGEVHVFNNYYLNNGLYGVASTMEADVVMEGNYFDGVPFPSYSGYQDSGPGDLVERNNVYHNSGTAQTRGTAFEPQTYYTYVVGDPALVPDTVRTGAGVGVIDPLAARN